MLKRLYYFFLALGIGMLGQSCSSGSLYVQKQERYLDNRPQITKLISIEPDILLVDRRKNLEDYVLGSEELEEEYQNLLVESARKNGIDLTVYASNNLSAVDVDYYNYLLPLKTQVLSALSSQEVEISEHRNRGQKHKIRVNNSYYEDKLEFDADFAMLEQKYGTPYFCINGLISVRRKKIWKWVWLFLVPPAGVSGFVRDTHENLYYNVIIDVRRGEIIHRELRTFYDLLSKPVMKSMVYDSFRIIDTTY